MDAVEALLSPVPDLYPLGKVPPKPKYPYGTVAATLGRGDAYTLDVSHGLRWGRVTVQCFGQTEDSATDLMQRAVDALLDQCLEPFGWECTPLLLELDPTIPTRDPDGGGVIGTTATFTFTATKEA